MRDSVSRIGVFVKDHTQELADYLNQKEGLNVCASAETGETAVNMVKSIDLNVAIVETALKGIDGIKLLDYIKEFRPDCACIVISDFDDDKIVHAAINHGAIYYLIKPVAPEILVERINDIASGKSVGYKVAAEARDKRRVASIDEKISNIFITIGIPPHIKGFVYLREGIKMCVENPSVINKVTKELYPKIGEKYSTSASKVERAIRHAIEVAWNRGRSDAISSIFGARVYIGNERPTNSEFIALVADKLILDNLM